MNNVIGLNGKGHMGKWLRKRRKLEIKLVGRKLEIERDKKRGGNVKVDMWKYTRWGRDKVRKR